MLSSSTDIGKPQQQARDIVEKELLLPSHVILEDPVYIQHGNENTQSGIEGDLVGNDRGTDDTMEGLHFMGDDLAKVSRKVPPYALD